MAKKSVERITYSDLEPVILDLNRVVTMVEILLFRDAEESGWKTEFLSLLAMEDLKRRSEELVKLYYRAVKSERAEDEKPAETPDQQPSGLEVFAQAIDIHKDAIIRDANRIAKRSKQKRPKLTVVNSEPPAA